MLCILKTGIKIVTSVPALRDTPATRRIQGTLILKMLWLVKLRPNRPYAYA